MVFLIPSVLITKIFVSKQKLSFLSASSPASFLLGSHCLGGWAWVGVVTAPGALLSHGSAVGRGDLGSSSRGDLQLRPASPQKKTRGERGFLSRIRSIQGHKPRQSSVSQTCRAFSHPRPLLLLLPLPRMLFSSLRTHAYFSSPS